MAGWSASAGAWVSCGAKGVNESTKEMAKKSPLFPVHLRARALKLPVVARMNDGSLASVAVKL